MSQSAPNSRAPSPPPVPSISRGGSRPESGRRSKKRRKAEAANAVGNAVQDALRQHRRRLAEGISSLSNPSGRSLSSNELRIIIRLALWLQLHEDYSEDAAIKAASVWSGSGHMTVGPAYHHWWETGELLEPDTSQQGSGNPQHPRHVSSVSFEAILAIHQALADAKLNNEYMPARKLKKKLQLSVSVRQIQRLLKQLGYRWRRKRCMGRMTREQRAQRTRSFIKQLNVALKEEELGSAVIVYMDESYIHCSHSFQLCWALAADAEGHHVRGAPGKGKRLIILHAMTKDGLLHFEARGRNVSPLSNDVSEAFPSCEFIFEAALDSEDYHKNMNNTVFMQWVRNRLMPAFQRKYGPRMKMILVLDNARYHHPRHPDWISPNQMKKEQLAAWIASNPRGENGITIQRDGRTKYFGRTALFQHGGIYAPSVAELRAWVKADLLSHPDTNRNLLQKEFDAHGYQTIYTPPYECETQPIELLWAYVKNYVARVMGDDHSIETVTRLTRQGFYGDPANSHAPVNAQLCSKLIKHVHTYLNAFIEKDEELEGTLTTLSEIIVPADDPMDDVDDEEEAEQDESSEADDSEEEETDSEE
jgi:hypothetical protein